MKKFIVELKTVATCCLPIEAATLEDAQKQAEKIFNLNIEDILDYNDTELDSSYSVIELVDEK